MPSFCSTGFILSAGGTRFGAETGYEHLDRCGRPRSPRPPLPPLLLRQVIPRTAHPAIFSPRFCNKSDYVPVEKDAEAAIIKPVVATIRKEEDKEKNGASGKLEALLGEEKKEDKGPSEEEKKVLKKTLESLETVKEMGSFIGGEEPSGPGVKILVLPLPHSKDTVDSGHKTVRRCLRQCQVHSVHFRFPYSSPPTSRQIIG